MYKMSLERRLIRRVGKLDNLWGDLRNVIRKTLAKRFVKRHIESLCSCCIDWADKSLCVKNKRKEREKIRDGESMMKICFSLLDTVFWVMVGFDEMMCSSGFFEG
jgi:hypothetical protein